MQVLSSPFNRNRERSKSKTMWVILEFNSFKIRKIYEFNFLNYFGEVKFFVSLSTIIPFHDHFIITKTKIKLVTLILFVSHAHYQCKKCDSWKFNSYKMIIIENKKNP